MFFGKRPSIGIADSLYFLVVLILERMYDFAEKLLMFISFVFIFASFRSWLLDEDLQHCVAAQELANIDLDQKITVFFLMIGTNFDQFDGFSVVFARAHLHKYLVKWIVDKIMVFVTEKLFKVDFVDLFFTDMAK